MRLLGLIIWKEFHHIRRDVGMLRQILFMPVLQLFVLSYAITTEVKNTPFAVRDECNCPASASLIASTTASPLFKFQGYARSTSELRTWMDEGRIRIALLIPPDFSYQLEKSLGNTVSPLGPSAGGNMGTEEGAPLGIWVDGQDVASSSTARGYLSSILNQWSQDKLQDRMHAQGREIKDIMPFQVNTLIAFNPLLVSNWYMVPGIAVILITMVTALLTGFSIVREKETGTLEQLLVTPVKPIHLVLGKSIPFFVIGLVEIFTILFIARLWFGIPFRGDYLDLALFASAYMLSTLGIGILVSTVANTMQQVQFIIWFFLTFFMMLSGYFLPVENMPAWVQVITRINPMRYFMLVLRSMFLKGSGFQDLWQQGAAMLGIGVLVFGTAVALFHRKSA